MMRFQLKNELEFPKRSAKLAPPLLFFLRRHLRITVAVRAGAVATGQAVSAAQGD